MNRLLLALILTTISTSVMAEWTYVSKSNDFSVHVAKVSIRKSGNKSTIWTLFDFMATHQLSSGEKYLSYRQQLEFNCKTKQMKILSYIVSAENMGKGKTVLMDDAPFDSIDDLPSEWEPDAPLRMQNVLSQIACR